MRVHLLLSLQVREIFRRNRKELSIEADERLRGAAARARGRSAFWERWTDLVTETKLMRFDLFMGLRGRNNSFFVDEVMCLSLMCQAATGPDLSESYLS